MGIGQDLPLCVITASIKLVRIKQLPQTYPIDSSLSVPATPSFPRLGHRLGLLQNCWSRHPHDSEALPGYSSNTLPIELMKTTQLITVIPKNPREIKGETITHTLLFLSSNNRCTSLKVGTKSARS